MDFQRGDPLVQIGANSSAVCDWLVQAGLEWRVYWNWPLCHHQVRTSVEAFAYTNYVAVPALADWIAVNIEKIVKYIYIFFYKNL